MIYAIRAEDTDYYKIGFTAGPLKRRLAELQTSNPFRLVTYAILKSGTPSDERKIHAKLADFKTNGGDEWFQLTEEQVNLLTEGWSKPDSIQNYIGTGKQYAQLRAYQETQVILNFLCSISGRSQIMELHTLVQEYLRNMERIGAITEAQLRRFFPYAQVD